MIRISPSMLAADFTRLADDLGRVTDADYLHVDVMDGHFVPNISFGPGIVEAARRSSSLPLDVHLMVEHPERLLDLFYPHQPAVITVQYEACVHLQRILSTIRQAGCLAGVALNPHTPEECLRYVLPDLDQVLVMTVNPGFGGQAFLPAMLEKIRRVKEWVQPYGIPVQVDGGISLENLPQIVEAGAEIIVAGSAIFSAASPSEYMAAMRNLS